MPSLFQDLQQQVIQELGATANGQTVIFQPQDNSEPQTINGIIAPPPLLEQVPPGSNTGVTVIYLFIRLVDITPNPRLGDVLTLDGVGYDITDILADSQGGATLKLRRNHQ